MQNCPPFACLNLRTDGWDMVNDSQSHKARFFKIELLFSTLNSIFYVIFFHAALIIFNGNFFSSFFCIIFCDSEYATGWRRNRKTPLHTSNTRPTGQTAHDAIMFGPQDNNLITSRAGTHVL